LWIWGPPQLNVLPLHSLIKLRDLSLMGMGFGRLTAVTDIDALRDLKDLRKLTLGSLQIGDLTFVNSLKNLNEINIGDLPISSVEPLRGLTSLKRVSLSLTPVVDISPLLDLPALNSLTVIRTPARADVLTELERRGVKVNR
jgi:internalin A